MKKQKHYQYIDLSHAITENMCSFRTDNLSPEISYLEDDANGLLYINSQINNFSMNTGTHITFPGSNPRNQQKNSLNTHQVSIDTFIGSVIILDFSNKLNLLKNYYNSEGRFQADLYNQDLIFKYLTDLETLTISIDDYDQALTKFTLTTTPVKGIIFYTGLSKAWIYKKFESWELIYFLGLDISRSLCARLIKEGIQFVGIDSFQIGNPIINYTGQEKPFTTSLKCQKYIRDKLKELQIDNNRDYLLNNKIFLYESLNVPETIVNQTVKFFGVPLKFDSTQLDNCCTVRPFIQLEP